MEFFIQQLVNGIALGSLYALTAIGYSLVYAVLELINFTHGTMYMVGAYLFYIFASLVGMPFFPAFLLAILLTGCLGYLIERYTLRPLRKKKLPKFTALICTIGVSIVIQNVMLLFLGSETRQYPTLFDGKYITVATANVSYIQLFVIAMSILMMVGLTIFIKKSKTGMAMRATAQNAEATELMGIPADRVVGLTFFFGLRSWGFAIVVLLASSASGAHGVKRPRRSYEMCVVRGAGRQRAAR